MTAIVLKTVVLGVLALKVMAVLIAKVAVIMKVTAAAAVLALLFFHGFQKDISYQVVTQQNKPDSYEPDPHSHQEEYGGDSYSNIGGGGGGGYVSNLFSWFILEK
ncbi:uncharacterized protein LOC124788836 [Schistocerca piceifrons]|uniref:uncharacterized protein LOC124788836 n=1 Tax=Schistocerca piceifrons TaxID=274613 RepID=UPI001F5F627B|nr:uncharacterized protein LOC124788836 [Schistocerca piceifrons]